jgi:hypothetical protein
LIHAPFQTSTYALSTCRSQRTISLPQHRRGCHIITNKIYEAVPEIAEYEVRAGDGACGARVHASHTPVTAGWHRASQAPCFRTFGQIRMLRPIRGPATPSLPPLPDNVRPAGPADSLHQVGLANIFILHTSASLTINENASPDVLLDLNVSLIRSVHIGPLHIGPAVQAVHLFQTAHAAQAVQVATEQPLALLAVP